MQQVKDTITICEIAFPASSTFGSSRVKNESKLSSIISLASICIDQEENVLCHFLDLTHAKVTCQMDGVGGSSVALYVSLVWNVWDFGFSVFFWINYIYH